MSAKAWCLAFAFACLCASGSAQWIQTNGPSGGEVRAIGRSNRGTIFAATKYHGLYRSTDNGKSWSYSQRGLAVGDPGTRVGAFAFVGNEVFISTSRGIYRSTDDGEDWSIASSGLTFSSTGNKLVTMGETLFADTKDSGVFRSTDHGQNWTPLQGGVGGLSRTLLVRDTTLFLGTDGGLFTSTLNGRLFSRVGLQPIHIVALAAQGDTLYAAAFADGIYRSTDDGVTWDSINTGLPHQGSSFYFLSAAIHAFGAGVFVGTTEGVFRSTDAGQNWAPANGMVQSVSARQFLSDGATLYAAGDRGVLRTTSMGAEWDLIGIPASTCNSILVNNGFIFAATDGSGLFRSDDNGARWVRIGAGLPSSRIIAVACDDGLLAAGTYDSGVFRSTDNGDHWFGGNVGLDELHISSVFVREGIVLAGTNGSGIYLSTDGYNWSPAAGSTQGHWVNVTSFMRWEETILAGTNCGVHRSSDGGGTWSAPANDLNPAYVSSLASLGPYLFAGTLDGTYRSENGGATWRVSSNGLTSRWVQSLASDRVHLFAGTRGGGVFLSKDRGHNWEEMNEGITTNTMFEVTPWVDVLSLTANCYTLLAGIGDGGVFRGEINEMIPTTSSGAGTTGGLVLAQNFPNPFNSTTTIWYYLPIADDVRLKLFDLLGREIVVLEEAPHGAGWNSLTFSAEGLASGIYAYRLQAGNMTLAKMLLLLK